MERRRARCELLESRLLLSTTKFAVIGDFGFDGPQEAAVSTLVHGWNPDFVATVGDNNYSSGGADTIDANIGKYYHDYIYHYTGSYGAGSPTRRFFPALGNHDWGDAFPNPTGAQPYLDYFDLPGNERYYDFVAGPVHFFIIDSDPNEPSGNTKTSAQAQWLHAGLAAATEPHKLVLLHHAPYSSSSHGSNTTLQWPYSQWGATAVLAGHDHSYERLFAEGIPYFVDGLGGRDPYPFVTTVPQSQFQYNADNGAMLIEADDAQMSFKFYNDAGALIDQTTLVLANALPVVSVAAADAIASEPNDGATFTVSRTGSTAAPLVVNFTLSGTASNGNDYQTVPLSVTIPIGSFSANVQINPIDDTAGEGSETVQLSLANTATYNVGQDVSAAATIADNDSSNALLFSGGSAWKYKDDGSNQGTAWIAPGFNDAAWASGGARLGYGDPGMVTTINGGPTNARFTTTYFRTSFNLANATGISAATLNVLRDDGAIIYLNGNEVWRTNMPAGAVTSSTFASTGVSGTDETTFFTNPLDPSLLVAGTNFLAVELHQSSLTTSDAVFDMYITATRDTAAPVVRSKVFDNETWHSVQFDFSEDVSASLTIDDLVVKNLTTNQTLPPGSFTFSKSGTDLTTGVWRATTLLPDGLYRATLAAGNVSDRSGNALASPATLDFRVLRGDANNDGVITFDDYVRIDLGFNNHSTGFSNGDFNYDGVVNFDDYVIIDIAFNTQSSLQARSPKGPINLRR